MADIYEHIDRIASRNEYPDDQPSDNQRPSNPEGDVLPETVDFLQQHPFKDQFNEPTGLLSLYDPDNKDRQYMDLVESEVIALSSPPIKYYKLRVLENNVDPLYGEATRRDGYDYPVTIFGNYEAPVYDQELAQFGLTEMEELEITFNYNHLLHTIGDKLDIGDIIVTYDAKMYEVLTSTLINENLWRAQHNFVRAKRLRTEGIYLPDAPDITQSPNVEVYDG